MNYGLDADTTKKSVCGVDDDAWDIVLLTGYGFNMHTHTHTNEFEDYRKLMITQ